MASMEYERDIVNQLLQDDTAPLKIYTSGKTGPFYIQKALLSSVSTKLADLSSTHVFDHIGEKAFRLFVTWLLYRKMDKRNDEVEDEDGDEENDVQTPLAQAWNFGAEYNIPEFQNAIMEEVVHYIGWQRIEPEAMKEAYRPTARGTQLQKALVSFLAKDLCAHKHNEAGWEREHFVEHGMESVEGFCLDLVQAMGAACHCNPSVPKVWDLLVIEGDEEYI